MIIDYLKANARFSLIFLISTIICALIIALIVIFYKKSKSNISNDLSKNNENSENSLKILDNLTNHEDFENKNGLTDESLKNSNTVENDGTAFEIKNKNENPDGIYSFDQINLQQEEGDIELPIEEECNNLQSDSEISIINSVSTESTVIEQSSTDENAPVKSESIKYAGKWIIYEEDGRFYAELRASNGELMLRTEYYSSLSGIKSGIETLKKNIEMENYAINLDKNGNFVFKIFSTAKRLLCVGEGYSTREQCEKAFNSVKRFSQTGKIVINGK